MEDGTQQRIKRVVDSFAGGGGNSVVPHLAHAIVAANMETTT